MQSVKDFLKEIESEFFNFNPNYKKREMVNSKKHENLEEYVNEKIKFISSIDF